MTSPMEIAGSNRKGDGGVEEEEEEGEEEGRNLVVGEHKGRCSGFCCFCLSFWGGEMKLSRTKKKTQVWFPCSWPWGRRRRRRIGQNNEGEEEFRNSALKKEPRCVFYRERQLVPQVWNSAGFGSDLSELVGPIWVWSDLFSDQFDFVD